MQHTVIDINFLTAETFVLRITREGLNFIPGQYITLLVEEGEGREYSIYSGIEHNFLEFLIRKVENGKVSKLLSSLIVGDTIQSDGRASGEFIIDKIDIKQPIVFIATGTGIAPFQSIIRSYPGLNYTLIHAIRYTRESYGSNHCQDELYITCVSRDDGGSYNGYVTDYLNNQRLVEKVSYRLCGNVSALRNIVKVLGSKGIDASSISSEVFF